MSKLKTDSPHDVAPSFPYREQSDFNDFYQLAILETKPDGLQSFTLLVDTNDGAIDPIEPLEPLIRVFRGMVITEEKVSGSNFQIKVVLSDKKLYNHKYYLNAQLEKLAGELNRMKNKYERLNK